jgi:DNA gyrase subunit A
VTDQSSAGPTAPPSDITPVAIEEEMKRSYLDYAMSVIVSRALPDVRDGLKPVHRRILFAMNESGFASNKPYKKSAAIVGDVMGKYHPHGDSSIYDAMVRMVQDFSMRLPLVDGQGNFGSMDGDSPAAMRYTEARFAKAGEALLEDIDKETVDYQPNYDESLREPLVLPARFPNLLVNGAGGIAVGMATNIPPHNLGEVIDACLAYLEDNDVSIDRLIELVPGPDFPTGATILGRSGIRSAYHTGHGSITVRAKTFIEERGKDRQSIIVSEIPFQQNKSRLVERIAEVVNDKSVEGISDLRDESDRDGVRIVMELKRDAMAEVVLAQLYRFTPLQTSFGCNMLALTGGRPRMMNLKEIISAFVDFREEVIRRRTIFELKEARARAHILAGLALAVANIDEIIEAIRAAPDPAAARIALTGRSWPVHDLAPLIALIDEPGRGVADDGTYMLSEEQARAILELRLQRLTGLEREKIADELREITDKISDLLATLADRPKLLGILGDELRDIKTRFANPRRTTIEDNEFESDIEDLIQREEMVVTVSMTGYVKRVPLSTYRAQKRGGKGRTGMTTKDEDVVSDLFVASTHAPVLFFTTRGIVHRMKVYRLPLSSPQARGKAFVNLLPLNEGETISAILPLPEDETTWDQYHLMFATSGGTVRRNLLSDFANIRSNGLIAMKLEDDERLLAVATCNDDQDVLLATRDGKCIRFAVPDVRVFAGRTSTGVRGIKLAGDDEVISMSILTRVEATPDERAAYVKQARQKRDAGDESLAAEESDDEAPSDGAAGDGATDNGAMDNGTAGDGTLSAERAAEMETLEQFILSVSERGYGKRSSAYEYRSTNRGGQGIQNMEVNDRNGRIVATFPVGLTDGLMLVSDGGQVIRTSVNDVRIAGRRTQGVTLFKVAPEERVVSVARIDEESGNGDDSGNNDGDDGMAEGDTSSLPLE